MIAEDAFSAHDDPSFQELPGNPEMTEKEGNKKESQLIDYLDDVLENPNPLPRDLKFNDSDLPEFKNFFHWNIDPRGSRTRPFARQLAIGLQLFAEYCPRCSHPKMGNIYTVPYRASMEKIAESVTFLEYGICPRCGARKSELINNDELALYDEFAGAIGQRGGKSAMFSLLAPYITHKYLKMQNPNRLFGQMEHTVLSGTFVGLTFARAMSLLWTPILNLIRTSEWFQDYHKLMDMYAAKYDVVPYVIKDTFLEYRHRRLRLYPSGPNKRTLRGDTRFMSGIDEAGWFYSGEDDDEERERASGKEVHGALDRSLKTIRIASANKIRKGYDNLICGYNISISSPSHERDLIMYLTALYKDSRECLAVRLPTWKFNPQYKGREDFKKEYAENAARAERDFGVNPQTNESKAFTQDEVVLMTNRFSKTNRVTIDTRTFIADEVAYTAPIVTSISGNDIPSVLSIDAGEVNNSFALSLIQRSDEKSDPVVAALIDIVPEDGTRINFNQVYTKLILQIFEKFHVVGVVADRWQSTAILNRITDEHGIHVKRISAKEHHFVNFASYHLPDMLMTYPKSEIPIDKVLAPDNEDYRVKFKKKPVAHYIHQLNTIQDINGVYEKGRGNTDDLIRSTVIGLSLITDPSFVEKYLKSKPRQSMSSIGVSSLGSVGGMGHITATPEELARASNIGATSLGSNKISVGSSGVAGMVMSRRR